MRTDWRRTRLSLRCSDGKVASRVAYATASSPLQTRSLRSSQSLSPSWTSRIEERSPWRPSRILRRIRCSSFPIGWPSCTFRRATTELSDWRWERNTSVRDEESKARKAGRRRTRSGRREDRGSRGAQKRNSREESYCPEANRARWVGRHPSDDDRS